MIFASVALESAAVIDGGPLGPVPRSAGDA
jgi:hypothetical protein